MVVVSVQDREWLPDPQAVAFPLPSGRGRLVEMIDGEGERVYWVVPLDGEGCPVGPRALSTSTRWPDRENVGPRAGTARHREVIDDLVEIAALGREEANAGRIGPGSRIMVLAHRALAQLGSAAGVPGGHVDA